ncbi:hypothetical protein FRB95_013142 [Tulasnella sp. JGI-2019a]|nr:hypothetical protein FRB95_013142 [Tulasnella sp. JGI-2019a]
MESALAVPEILDEILQLATPLTQAAAAQTSQYWSDCSLRWLWRHMESFYPLFELLSPLVCIDGTWEFTSDLSASDWSRFGRYAARVHSMKFTPRLPYQGQMGSVASPRMLDEFTRHCPTPDSMFPNLTEVIWRAITLELPPVLLFLVPTVKFLRLTCEGSMNEECIDVLEVLGPRKISLTKLEFTVETHDQAFLDRLPAILVAQRELTIVALPLCSATPAIVTVLGQLPSLTEYITTISSEFQIPLEIGMEFDWHDETFSSLERLTLCTSLADASDLVTKSHQLRLRHIALITRRLFSYEELPNFCVNLSTSQPRLTVIDLVLYPTMGSTRPLPFDLFRPLLQCTALVKLLVESHLAMTYDDKDIATMASFWPDLEVMRLCSSPAMSIGFSVGQPLRSVGTFTQSFPRLAYLSIYVNSLDVGLTSDAESNIHHRRLTEINFGTSPGPPGSVMAASRYLADIITVGGVIKGRRSADYVRFLVSQRGDNGERRRRAAFWSEISKSVETVHAGSNH